MPYHCLSNVNCSLCKGPCLLLFFKVFLAHPSTVKAPKVTSCMVFKELSFMTFFHIMWMLLLKYSFIVTEILKCYSLLLVLKCLLANRLRQKLITFSRWQASFWLVCKLLLSDSCQLKGKVCFGSVSQSNVSATWSFVETNIHNWHEQ